jgi:guanylate kinase
MIIGPSGVGKSTLIEHLGFSFVPTDTTREPRPGEKDGVDMNFRKDYDQLTADIKAGRFVQMAIFANGELYATKDTSYPMSGIATMPVMADVIPIFRGLGFKETISVFVAPPSYEEWMSRLKKHPVTPEQLKKRLAEARRSLIFALSDNQMHFVLNDNLDEAVRQTRDLVDGTVDEPREATARQAAKEMLEGIN